MNFKKLNVQKQLLVSLLTLITPIALATQANAAYTFNFLDAPGSVVTNANEINDVGQVVGHSIDEVSYVQSAILWNGKTATVLESLGGDSSATGINNAGLIVGWSNNLTPTYWNSNTTTASPISMTLSGIPVVNNSGKVVLNQFVSGVYAPVILNGSSTVNLGTLGGSYATATAINDSGWVVGSSLSSGNLYTRPTLWNSTTVVDLGGGGTGSAYDINSVGKIVGTIEPYSLSHPVDRRATLWDGGSVTTLGSLFDGKGSEANAINDSGLIVGTSYPGVNQRSYATLWDGTNIIDLESLLDEKTKNEGWLLLEAIDINNNGWIVGSAYNTLQGISRGYLLSIDSVAAIPEPQTYAMFLMGLGLLGFVGRRKQA